MLRRLIALRWKLVVVGGLVLIGVLQIGTNISFMDTRQDKSTRTNVVRQVADNFSTSGVLANGATENVQMARHHHTGKVAAEAMDMSKEPQGGPFFHMTNSSDNKFSFRQNPKWRNSVHVPARAFDDMSVRLPLDKDGQTCRRKLVQTCTESLQRRAFESKEFGSMFRPDIQMLINRNLFDLNEFWRMKNWEIPFGYKYYKGNIFYEEVRDALKLFPVEDTIFNFTGRSRPQCITCAVIGNGGMLNGSRMGEEIDRHSYVFRVNQAYTKGYEEDVGSRTTHYVFFDRSLRDVSPEDYPVSENIIYIYVPCRKEDFSYLKDIGKHTADFKVPPENVRIIHPDFMRYVHFVWMRVKSFRPTTGGIMTMAALHSCDKLSLYGLGYNTKYSNHYFDRKYKKFRVVRLSHDHKREISLWDSLDREGIVYWYRRDVFL